MLSNILSRLAYAALVGVVTFLIVLGLGEILVHVFNASSGYGQRVEGFSVIIGFLAAVIVFFNPGAPFRSV